MKKRLQILLLLTLPYLAMAQTTTLKWLANKSIYTANDTIAVLSFEEAQYKDASFLPYYSYQENLTREEAENYDYSFSLSNLVFSEISPDIKVNTAIIKDDFQVSGRVTSARRVYALEVFVLPFKQQDGKLYRLESFHLNIEKKPIIKLKSAATQWFADNSVLASGNWYKVGVKKDGIYKLTYSQLNNMGVDPAKVSVFTGTAGMEPTMIQDYVDDLKEIPIYDGGDYILFYGQSTNTWTYNSSSDTYQHEQHLFCNENYYFITSDAGDAKRIVPRTEPSGTPAFTYTTFVDYDFIEPEESNIGRSGREWLSAPIISGNSYTHTFSFNHVKQSTARARVAVAAESYSYSNYLTINIDDVKKERIILSNVSSLGTSNLFNQKISNYTFIPVGNTVKVAMDFSSQESLAIGYVDYFEVEVTCDLKLENDFLLFRNKPSNNDYVTYKLSNATNSTLIWDVSQASSVKSIAANYSNGSASFLAAGDELNEFVAIDINASIASPDLLGHIENQNLHATPVPDMVILTDQDFYSVAEKIADIHREKDNMDVFIVTQEQIFNEFSGGKADVTAIRWFMKSLYDRSADTDKFKYLLLLGDGSYNNRIYEKGSDVAVEPSRVMTYQSISTKYGASTYVSDDYYGLLDDNEGDSKLLSSTTYETAIELYDKVDIGIGRIPIVSVSEGNDVVDKIKAYNKNTKRTPWKNRLCFVADDEDNNNHLNGAENIAEKVRSEHPAMAVKKVYLDAFEQIKESDGQSYPDAKKLSDQYIDEGVLIWSYTGHGSPNALSGEKLMYISDITAMENLSNLPLWVTATCDFCPYDHNDELSSGETVLLNPKGGGIALFTTTRLVYSSDNDEITDKFFSYVLNSDSEGHKLRLGDICRLTKKATGTGANKRKFVLIGDPALQLIQADANWTVETDSINGEDIALFTDTLQSLSTMTVSGHIALSDGSVATDFNGLLYPIIYDKISKLRTLGNDDDSNPVDFLMWNSILYNGKTEVINGHFTFSFILPKDMDYSYGKGRIEYYATSEGAEANGYYEDFYLGGFNSNYQIDTVGPEINLYMNTPSFNNGDAVNTSPMLIAQVSDISGINTSGNSIGHDITLKLNNDPNTIEVINTSYTTNAGDYTRGTIAYSLSNLDPGEYTLVLKVWDMQNNSSTAEINFKVEKNNLPEIKSLVCYPNPFSLSSDAQLRIVAEHDRPDKTLIIGLEIFDVNGRILHRDTQSSYAATNKIYFDWTPSASAIKPGFYFYRITIDDRNQVSIGKSEKLLVTE